MKDDIASNRMHHACL